MQRIGVGRPIYLVLGIVTMLQGICSSEGVAQSRVGPARGSAEGLAHEFEEIAEGVYFATGTGSVFVQSNSLVIVNENDVVVVDSHVTPAAARSLLADLKTLTDKPVRYLINTHYHFDHAHGNQAFPEGVQIIGHEFTRQKLLGNVLEQKTYLSFTSGIPAQIEGMKQRLSGESDPARKAQLEERIRVQENHLAALDEIRPTPPDLTLKTEMTLFRGDREIQLHFLGRGHTGGDVVVFLPEERVIFTGDLMLPFLSYMGDAFVEDWDETLEAVKALDFDVALPGHGPPIRDKARFDYFQAYLRDLWDQASRLKSQGVSAQEAAQRVDLTAHRTNYPQIRGPGVDPRAVDRIYELLSER